MKITQLEVSNFKRIRAVALEPKGSVVRIRGRNGQGKSSVLDSIAALFGGEKLCPAQPIRRGQQEATVRARVDRYADLEHDFGPIVVERTFRLREDGSTTSVLKLTRDDGLKLDKPQRRLDELIGALTFDPLAFQRLAPKEQAETLRKLVGVDFSILDMKRAAAYESRTVANRQVAQLRARLAATPAVPDAPDEPLSAAALMEEHDRRRQVHDANEAKRRQLAAARATFGERLAQVGRAKDDVARLERELAAARERLGAAERARDEEEARGKALRAEIEALVDPDMEEVVEKLRDVEKVNERVRAKKVRGDIAAQLQAAEQEAAKFDAEVGSIDEQKEQALRDAKFPVEGLAFDADGVTLEGLPFEQASQAQQLRVSIAIGAALNPGLRAMLVRDGSALDDDSLDLLREEAERSDLQVFLESVANGPGGDGILIEDGCVVGEGAARAG